MCNFHLRLHLNELVVQSTIIALNKTAHTAKPFLGVERRERKKEKMNERTNQNELHDKV